MKKLLKKSLTIIQLVLAYLFLMIDRLTLVPFPFISSYSSQDWNKAFNSLTQLDQEKVNIKLIFAILRVSAFIIIMLIILVYKWLS
jgi:hypothetical protein